MGSWRSLKGFMVRNLCVCVFLVRIGELFCYLGIVWIFLILEYVSVNLGFVFG